MLPAEVLKLLRQWWKVRPTASNNGVAPNIAGCFQAAVSISQ